MLPILTADTVLLDLQVFYKEQAIRQLAEALAARGVVLDLDSFTQEALEREKYGTQIGCGVAAPHARCCYVSRIGVALARLPWPIDWNGQKTDLVFLLAVPTYADSPDSVAVLGRLFTRLTQPGVLPALRQAQTPQEVVQLLTIC